MPTFVHENRIVMIVIVMYCTYFSLVRKLVLIVDKSYSMLKLTFKDNERAKG